MLIVTAGHETNHNTRFLFLVGTKRLNKSKCLLVATTNVTLNVTKLVTEHFTFQNILTSISPTMILSMMPSMWQFMIPKHVTQHSQLVYIKEGMLEFAFYEAWPLGWSGWSEDEFMSG